MSICQAPGPADTKMSEEWWLCQHPGSRQRAHSHGITEDNSMKRVVEESYGEPTRDREHPGLGWNPYHHYAYRRQEWLIPRGQQGPSGRLLGRAVGQEPPRGS